MFETKPTPDLPQGPTPSHGTVLATGEGPGRDFLAEVLPPIPATIKVREGYYIDTSGLAWLLPAQISGTIPIEWSRIQTTPTMLRVLMGYVVAKLKGKSESYAATEYRRFSSIKDWSLLTGPWEQNGEIGLVDILAVQRHLQEAYAGVWKDYFGVVKRLYAWAAGKGVPGFTETVRDQLKRVKVGATASFVKRLDVSPGTPRNQATKNREAYDPSTFTLIAAFYHKAEGILRNGKVLYCQVRPEETGAKEGKRGVIYKEGRLMRPSPVGVSHLVVGWLAWRFGDRPDAFRKLRESHFEFIEVDGETVLAQIRMPESKIRHANYKAIQGPVAMGDELARLVPELITKNRALRERLGLDNTLDWPLFMVAQEGAASRLRKLYPHAHEDLVKNSEAGYMSFYHMLKTLFEALQVPNGRSGVIVPTFYSFRDGFTTNHIQAGTPPEVVAALLGKQVPSLAPYYKPGVRFTERLDLVPGFTHLAEAFTPEDPIPLAEVEPEALVPLPAYVEIDEAKTKVGATGRCGCIGAPSCPITMNGSTDCYLCPAFRAIVEGPHQAVLDALWARREALIRRGLPEAEYMRYDRHLAAIGVVIMKIHRMEEASK